MKLDIQCPQCGSNETQKFTSIISEGTTHTSGTTRSVSSGVGLSGGGLGVGVGTSSGTINATTMSELAKKITALKPRTKFANPWLITSAGFLILLFGVFPNIIPRFLGEYLMMIISLGGSVYAARKLYDFEVNRLKSNKQYNTEAFPGELQEWESKFYCRQCTHTYLPTTIPNT